MIIEWSPSLQSIEKARKMVEMRKQNMTWPDIAKQMGMHRTYCITLTNWYLRSKGLSPIQLNNGLTYEKVGNFLGISKQRVQQIIERNKSKREGVDNHVSL